MLNTLSNHGFIRFITDRRVFFSYSMEIIWSKVPVVDQGFNVFQMRCFSFGKQFDQRQFILEMIKDDEVFVKDIQNIRCVVLFMMWFSNGNRFHIFNGIEGCITEESDIPSLISLNLKAGEKSALRFFAFHSGVPQWEVLWYNKQWVGPQGMRGPEKYESYRQDETKWKKPKNWR